MASDKAITELINSGLTNQRTGVKSADFVSQNNVFKGVCTGYIKKIYKLKSGNIKRKSVDCSYETFNRKLDICPQCGYSLLWKKLEG
jgi:ribosomal protein S27AE